MAIKKLANAALEYVKHLAVDGRDFVVQALAVAGGSRILNGLLSTAPTTASTQATGTGNTAWNVNVDKGVLYVGGKEAELAATTDLHVHSGSQLVTNGQSCEAALVCYLNAGNPTLLAVKGAAAATGSQVAPTDAAISTAVDAAASGKNVDWVKVAHLTINRTGDTTVTQSQDNSVSDRGLKL